MGSALQGSDSVSGGTAPLKSHGPCHPEQKLSPTCGNALPEPCGCSCAAMAIISSGSVLGQREPSDTSFPAPQGILLQETQSVAGEVCWEQMRLSIPCAPVPHLLAKNCSLVLLCRSHEHLCAHSQLIVLRNGIWSLFVPFPRVMGCRTPAHSSINPASSLNCSSFNKTHSRFYLKSSLQMALRAVFGLCLLWQQVMDRAGPALSL